MTGQPAVSVPLAWAEVDGVTLPVGVQLVGRPYDEATLVMLAAQLEEARPVGAPAAAPVVDRVTAFSSGGPLRLESRPVKWAGWGRGH